ncbi:MAG: HD domain-containing protein [Acidimicrobiales bacterium]
MSEPRVDFTTMADGTRADYDLVADHDQAIRDGLADQVLGWLRSMDGPSPYRITRLEHCLQSAARAEADGADDETVACALLHDIGDVIGPANHSEVGAALLRPYVSEQNAWIIGHHGLFQGYYWFHHYGRDRNERDRYADHPWYDATVAFCAEWDQNCFDPAYPTPALEHFEPLVRQIFDRPPTDYV